MAMAVLMLLGRIQDANNDGFIDGTGINNLTVISGGYTTIADIDNNGIADYKEDGPDINDGLVDVCESTDSDNDDIPDSLDLDDDMMVFRY